jgi:ABC-2 type transport system ATP-binding protein
VSDTASHPVLAAHEIVCGYGKRRVLRGVDLRIEPGEIVALLGPNGAGKTTIMKVLVGLLDADSGRVTGPLGRGVGWVPQGGAIYARMTVRENLELFAKLLDLRKPADTAWAAAQEADLEPWYESLGTELSGGLRQRLNVAVGLLGHPPLLVLDEPTTGVDLVHRTALFRLLRERADKGGAVLYSTHSLEDAGWADRVVVVVNGETAYAGSLEGVADVPGADHHTEAHDPVSAGLLQLWSAQEDGAEK